MSKAKIDSPVLVACLLLSFLFGSVHGFSVFVEPMERIFAVSRSSVSLTYSIALMSLTVAVLIGHRIFALIPIRVFAPVVVIAASVGLLLASVSGSLYGAWIGYGVVFGFTNGLGYAFALQLPAQRMPERKGVLMGFVTAAYSVGACLSPWLLTLGIEHSGVGGGFIALAMVLLLFVPIVWWVLRHTKGRFQNQDETQTSLPALQSRKLILLWIGYGTAVAAGLMAIGHATGIARESGIPTAQLILAPALLTISGIPGSLLSGWLSDRVSARKLIAVFPFFSVIALCLLSIAQSSLILPLLALVGLLYGAIIVAYPVAISSIFGVNAGVRAYGKVFTAWGTAGLVAPWVAGLVYDVYGTYQLALWMAAGLALVSFFVISAALFLGALGSSNVNADGGGVSH
jgi:MFS transporter, OFA family, oxalate/formate antiporter